MYYKATHLIVTRTFQVIKIYAQVYVARVEVYCCHDDVVLGLETRESGSIFAFEVG